MVSFYFLAPKPSRLFRFNMQKDNNKHCDCVAAEFTPDELRTLHTMAVDYVTPGGSNDFDHCRVFYRNKPPDYFIRCQINDSNIMKVYMKDNNGDPASIINGQINGLFFATSVDPCTGGPPNVSHFGSRRISIPATAMLTKDSNLYFADFYCNHKAHYVTVVLTTPGSETDRFCEKKLIKLDIKQNDFLWRSSHVFVTGKVWVEVLFTEDVDLSRPDATFSIVYSKGTSTPGGLPKNPKCLVCNLPDAIRSRSASNSSANVIGLTEHFRILTHF